MLEKISGKNGWKRGDCGDKALPRFVSLDLVPVIERLELNISGRIASKTTRWNQKIVAAKNQLYSLVK